MTTSAYSQDINYRNYNFTEGLLPSALLPKPQQFVFSLSYLTFKVSASVFLQRLNFVTRQIQESEEDLVNADEEIDLWDIFSPQRPTHEWNVWQGFTQRVRLGVVFELCVQAFYVLEQVVAANVCDARTFHKLFKPVPESAIRKASLAAFRGWSQPMLGYKVFYMALRGQALYWTALFFVSVAFDVLNVFPQQQLQSAVAPGVPGVKPVTTTANGKSTSSNVVAKTPSATFQKRLGNLFVKCCFGWGLAALGAAIGTLIRPGFGTNLGMLALSSLSK